MLKTFLSSARALTAAASLACVAMVGSVGFAAATSGTLPVDGNTAVTFDPSTDTPVVVRFTDPNITTGTHFQLGFQTNSSSLFQIGLIEYSLDTTDGVDGTWATYINPFGYVGAFPVHNYDGITTYSTMGNSIYFRYTIPNNLVEGPDVGSITQATLLANNGGYTEAGILAENLGNGFVELNREHNAVVPEPTSMAIASIGLGLAGAARLRRRLAAKKA
jgi:hypothetical protein